MLFLLLFLLSCKSTEKKSVDIQSIVSSNVLYRFENSSDKILYAYPRSDSYRKGDFELKSVELRDMGDAYMLCIEIYNNFGNNFALPGGWDTQVFDVYFFTANGLHKQALKKRKVKFSKGWEKAVLISPLRLAYLKKELLERHADVSDDVSTIDNVSIDTEVADTIRVYENKIFVRLPKSTYQNTIERLEGIQVLASNLDEFPIDGISINQVEEESTESRFGNGSYSGNHPNIISILGNVDQLSTYSEEITSVNFATVDPVQMEKASKQIEQQQTNDQITK